MRLAQNVVGREDLHPVTHALCNPDFDIQSPDLSRHTREFRAHSCTNSILRTCVDS